MAGLIEPSGDIGNGTAAHDDIALVQEMRLVGPIGRFVRRTTLRENIWGTPILGACPSNGGDEFWDAEEIETVFGTP